MTKEEKQEKQEKLFNSVREKLIDAAKAAQEYNNEFGNGISWCDIKPMALNDDYDHPIYIVVNGIPLFLANKFEYSLSGRAYIDMGDCFIMDREK